MIRGIRSQRWPENIVLGAALQLPPLGLPIMIQRTPEDPFVIGPLVARFLLFSIRVVAPRLLQRDEVGAVRVPAFQ